MKIRKFEIVLIAALLVACAAWGFYLYRPRGGDTIAVITADSQEVRRIDLAHAKDEVFTLKGKPVSFEVLDGKIRFVNVTCPDHICEKAGWCESPGDRAVCMPNRVTLVCYPRDELN
ncbi:MULTISPECIES: NusG domain II-containing protein [Anaerotruncus]|jgi:hypothetical protein|uniref:NusG domain II-containing protein n=1 Tax=Anaerotruncus TaxID=244127 RepID=UPI000836FCA9|nr:MULTISPECIES: NusG domain II-containing protein [Anaerotruncus]RGX55622.1 NusG domain II-containing protein [Anaerotruncus sp. AF02-27]